MSTILINNSFCELTGFGPEATNWIKEELTYTNEEAIHELRNLKVRLQIAQYRRNAKLAYFIKRQIEDTTNNIEVCLLKTRFFPTGLLGIVCELLNEKDYDYKLKDLRKQPERGLGLPWNLSDDYQPRYYQKEMLETVMDSKGRIINERGVFVSCVGSGKTMVMQMIIKALDVKTLIVCPSTDLKEQTYDSMVECFGSKYVEKISSGSMKTNKLKPIRVCNIQTLAALNKKNQLDKVLDGVDLVCIDEFHHVGADSYLNLLPKLESVYFRYGFTGTYLRNDSKTMDMYGVLSNVLYTYGAKQAVEEGFLTPLKVTVHELPGKRGSNYQKEYTANYCSNHDMLAKILEILTDEVSPGEQVLILVKQKDAAGKIIHEYLEHHDIPNVYISGDDSKDKVKKALKDFNNKAVKVLVGSTIIGEGIDVRSTDHMIMAQGGKSEIAITQATGRAVRLYPGKVLARIHDFNFIRTKYMESHLVSRIKIYEKNFGADIEVIGD